MCLLDAPASMKSKFPVMERYKPGLSRTDISESPVRQFFSDILEIPTCQWQDFMEELEYLKQKNIGNFDHIREMYKRLEQKRVIGISAQEIRYDTTKAKPTITGS